MTDIITLDGPSLADFLNRLGLLQSARDRIIEIDRTLATELASERMDADRCAELVLEAADMLSGRLRRLTSAISGFDFDAMDWGEE